MLGDGYMNFTGYPSIDNIHNKDYSFFDRNFSRIKFKCVSDKIKSC